MPRLQQRKPDDNRRECTAEIVIRQRQKLLAEGEAVRDAKSAADGVGFPILYSTDVADCDQDAKT